MSSSTIVSINHRAKVWEVDSRNGKIDGEISQQIFVYPCCGDYGNSSHKTCIMCGRDLLLHKPHIFEG